MQKAATLSVILSEITGLNGSGQGGVFFDLKGMMWYVFHFHNSPERVSPQRTAIIRLIKKTIRAAIRIAKQTKNPSAFSGARRKKTRSDIVRSAFFWKNR